MYLRTAPAVSFARRFNACMGDFFRSTNLFVDRYIVRELRDHNQCKLLVMCMKTLVKTHMEFNL